jgi:hypothetical protein
MKNGSGGLCDNLGITSLGDDRDVARYWSTGGFALYFPIEKNGAYKIVKLPSFTFRD